MAQTYVEKNTNSDLTTYNDASSGTVNVRKALDTTSGSTVQITSSLATGGINKEIFITIATQPNSSVWVGGTYTINVNVKTKSNRNSSIIEVILARISSNGSVTRATKSSGVISISTDSTGVKTQNIVWNDGTQNPAGMQSNDRLAIIWRVQNGSGSQTDSYKYEVESLTNSDSVVTPLIPNSLTLTETLILSDIIKISASIRRSESITPTDNIKILAKAALSNILSITDTLKKWLGIKVTEPLTLTDRINLSAGNQLFDTLILSDYINLGEPRELSDILILSDELIAGIPFLGEVFVTKYSVVDAVISAFVIMDFQIWDRIFDTVFVKKV